MNNYCAIDFEYNNTAEAKLNLVSVSWTTNKKEKFSKWLHNDEKAKKEVKKLLLKMRDNSVIFVAHNVVAEASSFIALGVDPTKCYWVDTQAEMRMLTNHWNKFRYGKQLISGKEVNTISPEEYDYLSPMQQKKARKDKAQTSLSATIYKLLDKKIDTDHKNKMRDLIISDGPFNELEIESIIKYNLEDTTYLIPILCKIIKHYKETKADIKLNEMLYRGNCNAHTAKITCRGYPVSKLIHNFATGVPNMIKDMCSDINDQFTIKPFRWDERSNRYAMQQKVLQDQFETWPEAKDWPRTDTGKISLSLEAFEKVFKCRSPYERNNLASQLTRYFRFQQSLNGFKPVPANSTRKSFFTHYGKDNRARAWLNPYGSQSSRFQPGASGYIPLKANWMRWFIQPKKGKALAGIDYGSQEFLIAALLSQDSNMIEAYGSGDPYLWLGKKVGFIPQDGTKQTHAVERDLMKSTCLGILFHMSCYGLSKDLTRKTGKEISPDQAQTYIDMFYKAFSVYGEWIEKWFDVYKLKGYAKLYDGWTMFGDNPNERSAKNFPIQGHGAVVLRKAIRMCHDANLKVIMPLHDALYIEYDIDNKNALSTFYWCMYNAFIQSFDQWKLAGIIRLDGYTWSKEFEDGQIIKSEIPFKTMKYYLEDRGKSEFETFSKHFIM